MERGCGINDTDAVSHSSKLHEAPFTSQCIQNLKTSPALRWQFFNSVFGVKFLHPATNFPICATTNSRSKPWYVNACIQKAKNVVIVIDKSASMLVNHDGVPLMTSAIDATKAVISTLNFRDMFAVVLFSYLPEVISGGNEKDSCVTEMLTKATPSNVATVYKSLDQFQAGGSAYYGKAIIRALQLLEDQHNSSQAHMVEDIILFMSDGDPGDTRSNIFNSLKIKYSNILVRPHFFAYGLGSADFEILRDLAENNPYSEKKGKFVQVTDPSSLVHVMGTYGELFVDNHQYSDEVSWTGPYVDALGLGYLMTASLPVFRSGNFLGVVGADVILDELLADSKLFKPNQYSYSFVIEESGFVLVHPMFSYEYFEDIEFLSTTTFERDEEFIPIFESMKKGENGELTFNSTKYLRSGDYPSNMVRKTKLSSTYTWRKLPHSIFSVCFVVTFDGGYLATMSEESLPPDTFLYHRYDLIPPRAPCYHIGQLASMNETAVFFGPRAFQDPDWYFQDAITRDGVVSLTMYLEGSGPNVLGLKDTVKNEVLITSKAQSLWTSSNQSSDLQRFILWRFITTTNDVFRIFPGTQMPREFDPTTRPWYQSLLANPHRVTVSGPYLDVKTRFRVVTICSNLYFNSSKSSFHDKRMTVFGVMCADIILSYLGKWFEKLYPEWSNTRDYKHYIMNTAGYMVLADIYLLSADEIRGVKHLAEVESVIARILIEDGILQPVNCSLVEASKLQRQYQVVLNQPYYNNNYRADSSNCVAFSLVSVPETNIFLLIRTTNRVSCENATSVSLHSCSCTAHSHQACLVGWTRADSCNCPCLEENPYYVPCLNKYESNRTNGDVPSPCIPTGRETEAEKKTAVFMKEPICYEIHFDYTDSREVRTKLLLSALILFVVVFIASIIVYNYKKEKYFLNKRSSIPWEGDAEGHAAYTEGLIRAILNDQVSLDIPQANLTQIAAAYFYQMKTNPSNSALMNMQRRRTSAIGSIFSSTSRNDPFSPKHSANVLQPTDDVNALNERKSGSMNPESPRHSSMKSSSSNTSFEAQSQSSLKTGSANTEQSKKSVPTGMVSGTSSLEDDLTDARSTKADKEVRRNSSPIIHRLVQSVKRSVLKKFVKSSPHMPSTLPPSDEQPTRNASVFTRKHFSENRVNSAQQQLSLTTPPSSTLSSSQPTSASQVTKRDSILNPPSITFSSH